MGISNWFKSDGYISLSDDAQPSKRRKIILISAIAIAVVILTVGRFHDFNRSHHGSDGASGSGAGAWNKQLMLFLDKTDHHHSPPKRTELVEVFDVYAPPTDLGPAVHAQSLIQHHEFGNSYHKPFVAKYTPPDEDFTHVRLLFNATTYGRQFDRLAHAYLDGTEIWRTSTAEPGNRNITFGYIKDVSSYASIFKKSDIDFTFELNNVVNDVYTGPITVSLTVEYFNVPQPEYKSVIEFLEKDVKPPTDVIALAPPEGKLHWSAPSEDISSQLSTLPKDTARAVLEVFASGNAEEEFWYSHLLDPYAEWFPKGANEFGKHGPTRLVEVYIDNILAGVAAPFPIIYTGGYSPPLWSKIVGTKAYDVPSYQIDLTPFLPHLWKDSGSTISLKVVNGDRRETSRTLISEDWIVNANLLVWQLPGVEGSGVTNPPKNKDSSSRIVSPRYGTRLSQIISFSDRIFTSANLDYTKGDKKESLDISWTQKVSLANVQEVSSGGDKHEIVFSSSTHNELLINEETISANSKFTSSHGLVLTLKYNPQDEEFLINYVRGYGERDSVDKLSVGQNGTSTFKFTGPRQVTGHGKLETNYTKKSDNGDVYHRHVRAEDGELIFDHSVCNEPGLYGNEHLNVQTFLNIDGIIASN